MASAANVRKGPTGARPSYFSRYFDAFTAGVGVFTQNITHLKEVSCFPRIPIIGKVVKFLQQHKLNVVIILPAFNAPWINLESVYIQDVCLIPEPF